ncbi:MAG: oligosaccharide flippase family protein [Erysipelotrichaceae bacterium]|nr:oligosaccharide flippase family protein [Erysipelotrichaceae bacterium]
MINREINLFKNTIILSIGKFLPMLVSTITLPIITACLTKVEYGTYDLISTLIMLILPAATLQIQSAAFRFLIECRKDIEKSSEVITNILFVIIPISLIVSFFIFIFYPNIEWSSRILISVYFFLDSLVNAFSQIVRGLGRNSDYAISSIILSIVNCIGIIITLSLMNMGINGALASLCMANFFALFFFLLKDNIIKYIKYSKISVKLIKEMISYSWPMIPNNLSNWVLKLSDRLVITAFLGIEANAIYAVANKIPNILSSAQGVLVAAWQENASLYVNDKDANKYFSNMFDHIFSLMIGITALLIAFTPILFNLLIKGDYGEAYYQMPILIFGMFFYCMSAFQGGIYIAHKKTKSVGITTTIAAAVNFIIDIVLVNIIGITAGSISTLISYFTLYIFRIYDSLKFQSMDYSYGKQVLLIIIIIFMLVFCFFQKTYLDILNMVSGFILFFYLNKDFIKISIDKCFHHKSE